MPLGHFNTVTAPPPPPTHPSPAYPHTVAGLEEPRPSAHLVISVTSHDAYPLIASGLGWGGGLNCRLSKDLGHQRLTTSSFQWPRPSSARTLPPAPRRSRRVWGVAALAPNAEVESNHLCGLCIERHWSSCDWIKVSYAIEYCHMHMFFLEQNS
jgi:hypothetical protein